MSFDLTAFTGQRERQRHADGRAWCEIKRWYQWDGVSYGSDGQRLYRCAWNVQRWRPSNKPVPSFDRVDVSPWLNSFEEAIRWMER